MNLNDLKKLVQETYDKGEFCGLSYDTKDNRICMAVKNKNHWIPVFLKSEYPKKDFESLQTFVNDLGKPKKVEKAVEKD
jgi:hypothetical protein